MDLSLIREDIDKVDKEIIELFQKRMDLCEEVAKYKLSVGKAILDKGREDSKIEKVQTFVDDESMKVALSDLFRQIMSSSRKLQYKFMEQNSATVRAECEIVDKIETQGAKVCYQGIEGAYSYLAMKRYFGEDVDGYNVPTFDAAMKEVAEGRADYAVLPIENSTAGIVNDTYDLLMKYDNYIVADLVYEIDHALLGLPGAKVSDISKVYSHPQGLMQCSHYLDEHLDWDRIATTNTSLGAKKVLADGDIHQAAIASREAAKVFGLEVIASEIRNEKNNATRFVIISKKRSFAKDAKTMSICFEIAHEAGSRYGILSHIKYNGLNMTKIQSRPIEGKMWQWRFYVDFEGNVNDAAVLNAMRGIEAESTYLKFLGNY